MLCLRQTVCWNLTAMNVIIWILWILKLSFKIRKKSRILGTFKIHKIRILNQWWGGYNNTIRLPFDCTPTSQTAVTAVGATATDNSFVRPLFFWKQ